MRREAAFFVSSSNLWVDRPILTSLGIGMRARIWWTDDSMRPTRDQRPPWGHDEPGRRQGFGEGQEPKSPGALSELGLLHVVHQETRTRNWRPPVAEGRSACMMLQDR